MMVYDIDKHISALQGTDELKALLTETLAGNVSPASFPHMLLSVDEGCGLTTIGKLVADAVEYCDILPAYSHENYIELRYPRRATPLEYARFFESPRAAAGLANAFGGVFMIDISGWESATESSEFEKLLRFCADNEQGMRYIFATSAKNGRTLETLLARLRRDLYVRSYRVERPDVSAFTDYAVRLLGQNDVEIDAPLHDELSGKIAELTQSDGFHGFSSVNYYVRDVCATARDGNLIALNIAYSGSGRGSSVGRIRGFEGGI